MSDIGIYFKEKFKQVVKNLTDEQYENFQKAVNDENRLDILFDCSNYFEIKPNQYGKSYDEARKDQEEGNQFFKMKQTDKAIEIYNRGIRISPQRSVDEKELHSILVANRSAALYDKKQYEDCLRDINYTLLLSYPVKLLHKVLMRKIRCLTHLQESFDKIVEVAKLAEESLIDSELSEKDLTSKKKEIKSLLDSAKKCCSQSALVVAKVDDKVILASNPYYLSAHASVSVKKDAIQGRYAFAIDNIDAGTVIVREKAHCAVLDSSFCLTNCQNCLKAVNFPIACPYCAYVIFCSIDCMNQALNSYHQYECGIQANLFETGASINCCIALRLITQKCLRYFHEKLDDPQRINRYDPEDYALVYDLCRNNNARNVTDYFQFTMMSLYLVTLLKSTFFKDCVDFDKEAKFIASLLLRHLQIVEFNAHEISELREGGTDEKSFKSASIGGGVYPTVALFNHSCDPSIIRFHIGSEMIVRTIKPIKEGEIIYENYGPLYMSCSKEERQKQLQDRYKFDCNCKPCLEDWQLFSQMQDDIITVPCSNSKCHDVFSLMDNFCTPLVTCSSCKKETNVLVYLAALRKLDDILNDAEQLYTEKNYQQAQSKFLEAIRIYAKCTVPPFPDWIKVQQRLRNCMINEGNKSLDYCKTFVN